MYRIRKPYTLIGHSYAGLFTLDTFLRHTELFDIYRDIKRSLPRDRKNSWKKLQHESGKKIAPEKNGTSASFLKNEPTGQTFTF